MRRRVCGKQCAQTLVLFALQEGSMDDGVAREDAREISGE
jgi:hypothetical protein